MLNLPRELTVIHQANLTVVVIEESGHDPIRALGLLLTHLPAICLKSVRSTGQIWVLRFAAKNHERPWEYLNRIAKHQQTDVQRLFQEQRLTAAEFARNPLADGADSSR